MLYLPYPRRRYRALFFPPGLLALAGLLWLGCVAVPPSELSRTKQTILQILIPPLHPSKEVQQMWYLVYASQREVAQFRPWQTFSLTGNQWADYHTLRLVRYYSKDLQNSRRKRGVCVSMENATTYASFVYLHNTLQELGIHKYWMDFQHQPYTLYAIENQPSNYSNWVCGGYSYAPTSFETIIRWLTDRQADFLAVDWRNTWLLLLLLTALSAWKLRRQWRAAYRY
ncbi:hypothetical protein [Hymenobacter sp. 102]|uniref:hypothetical protein n=1 Tax=Hymenobacter sp. 102 TaxID=3403152 RepID=UPI003CF6F28E